MALSIPFDLLVVDDNSPDGTAAEVTKLMDRYTGRVHLLRKVRVRKFRDCIYVSLSGHS